jgi:hypothetical protein
VSRGTNLAELHFGRFGRLAEAVWAALGLAPAILALTGAFICCRRVIFKKPSNPNRIAVRQGCESTDPP